MKEFKSAYDIDTMPKSGAGSEYGREQREEARRKKYGIKTRNYNPNDQPFILKLGTSKQQRRCICSVIILLFKLFDSRTFFLDLKVQKMVVSQRILTMWLLLYVGVPSLFLFLLVIGMTSHQCQNIRLSMRKRPKNNLAGKLI